MTYLSGDIAFQIEGSYEDTNPLSNITIAGLSSAPAQLSINGKCLQGTPNFANGVLTLAGLEDQTAGGIFQ